MENKKIVLLVGPDESSNYFYNSIKQDFDIQKVICEQTVKRKDFLKKRINRLGAWTVFGQVLFQVLVGKFLRLTSKERIDEISQKGNLDATPPEAEKVIHVSSINSDESLENPAGN